MQHLQNLSHEAILSLRAMFHCVTALLAGAETGTAGGMLWEADVGIVVLKARTKNKDVNIG